LSWAGLIRGPRVVRRRAAGYVLAAAGTIGLVALLLPFRGSIRPLSLGFSFLVLVVVSAWVGGLGPGIVASILAFLAFNFFFIPPYGTFSIGKPEDVVVLFVFLGVSVLIAILLAQATERAEAAEDREAELLLLQELSRGLVVQGPGEETYRELLAQIVDRFGFDGGALFVHDPTVGLRESFLVGAEPGEMKPTWDPRAAGPAPERLPLTVGRRNLGLLVLRGRRPGLTAAESRILRALCDLLAIVFERDRLLRAATEAEVLRQTEQMRRSVLAAVSHDLRSPLAAIKASVTDLLDEGVARSDRDRRDALETIDKASDRLNGVIANLLDVSRIDAGVLKARPERVDLAEAATAAADEIQARWTAVKIRTDIDDAAAVVLADPTFVDRVLSNLLDNAARAALDASRPEVTVDVRRTDGRTEVRVIDHGAGVPSTVREQLFYPFYRLQDRGKGLGQGLGLAIAKGFLSLMDGEIWVEDTPGGGATFAFSLPRRPDRARSAEEVSVPSDDGAMTTR